MLNGGREPRKLPMHLLSKLIDLTNRNNPRLYPILAQIQLMLKMNPGKYQSFEAMFGPTDSHLLYEWWKFAEESATMKLDFLVEYCSSQDKIVFLVKLSETKAIYVRVSLDTLTITEVYNVTDNRFSDNVMQSNITNIRYIQKFIRCIFDFERTFRVSRESVRIFHEISQVFMWNQILHMHQRVQTPMIFKYLKSLTISQRFKVRYALFGLKFMLVDRLVPTGRKRDPTQSNRKLHKMLHIYAAPRQ
jgi:hypothetical protein